jgi:AhpD family alkylhydroperoxidase
VVAERLEEVRRAWGRLPNMVDAMAVSPVMLEAYLGLERVVASGRLSPRLREQLALGAAVHRDCGYCTAAHTFLGRRVAGLTERDVDLAAALRSDDPAEEALLGLARDVLERHGDVDDTRLQRAYDAGWDAQDVAETVANLALASMTAMFNRLARPTVDWVA